MMHVNTHLAKVARFVLGEIDDLTMTKAYACVCSVDGREPFLFIYRFRHPPTDVDVVRALKSDGDVKVLLVSPVPFGPMVAV